MKKNRKNVNALPELTDTERRIVEGEYKTYIDGSLLYITLGSAIIILITQLYLLFFSDKQLFPSESTMLIKSRIILIFFSLFILLIKVIPVIKIRGIVQSYILLTGCTITSFMVLAITENHIDISLMWIYLSVFIGGIISSRAKWTILILTFLIPLYFLTVKFYTGNTILATTGLVLIYLLSFAGLSLLLKYYFSMLIEKQFYTKFIIKKLTEEKLQLEVEKRINNQKDEFLANTAHEIRTPLNGIIGLVENYLNDNSKDEKNLYIAMTAARRLSFLVNDIVDYSKLQYMQLKVERKSLAIKPLIDLTISLLSPLIINKSIKIRTKSISSDLCLLGDKNRILQILYNIVGNSIKYTNQGLITISAFKENDKVFISIEDTGIGIIEEKIDSVFENYTQAEENSVVSGSGIGLHITKKLVELQNGSINLVSTHGVGTTVTLSFDKANKSNNIINNVFTINGFIHELPFNADKPTIYVVDDDPLNLKTFQGFLKDLYNIKLFSSGESILEVVKNNETPDLIILDLILPDKSGVEVCREIRKRYNSHILPIIIITARSREGDLSMGLESGANEFLNKPVFINELRIRVKNLINLKISYKKNIESEQILSFIESLVELSVPNNVLSTENLLNLKLEKLSKILLKTNSSEVYKYMSKLVVLKENLKPHIVDNPLVGELTNQLTSIIHNKESFTSFVDRYKLTNNQANIVELLFDGEVLHERIAEKLNKSKTNIATTLRRIYDKIGVSNQTELLLNLKHIKFD